MARGLARSPQWRAAAAVRPVPPALYRNSAWIFAGFALAALIAFWPTYFSRLDQQPTYHPHAHGVAMTLWCVLLVAQAVLIRSGNRVLHRKVGTLSYVLVPLMVITTVNFISFRVQGARNLGPLGLYSLALILNALVAFLLIYGLAIYHRRQPAIHARYMLCTIFPLFTPVTDRLIAVHFPSMIPLVLRIDGVPILPVVGFALADFILVALSVWDWRANDRADVFPVALVVVLLYHASVLTFYQLSFWNAFGTWFASLPLS